eukprot:3973061-Amphidinium_carterae.1
MQAVAGMWSRNQQPSGALEPATVRTMQFWKSDERNMGYKAPEVANKSLTHMKKEHSNNAATRTTCHSVTCMRLYAKPKHVLAPFNPVCAQIEQKEGYKGNKRPLILARARKNNTGKSN